VEPASGDRRIARLALAGIGATLLTVAVLVLAGVSQVGTESVRVPTGPQAERLRSVESERYDYWVVAWKAFADRPFGGIGSGGFGAEWLRERPADSLVVRDAHSIYVETGAELGLVGLALVLGFFAIAATAGLRRWNRGEAAVAGALLALLAAGAFSASIDWMWELPAVFAPIVVAAALLTGPATAAAPSARGRTREVRGRPRLAAAVATGLIGWVAVLCAGDLLLTDAKLEESRSAAAGRDFDAAAEAANDAVALQPWAAEPRLQLGLVQEALGDYASAADTLRGAIDRAPDDWRIWFLLGRVEERSHRLPAARRAYARARALNPNAEFLDFTKDV
jgi:tetratricopeptide (TPR) repeat protein